MVINEDSARLKLQKPKKREKKCGFSSSSSADDTNFFFGVDDEADRVESERQIFSVLDRNVKKLDFSRHEIRRRGRRNFKIAFFFWDIE